MVIRQPLSPEEIDYLLGLMMEAEEPCLLYTSDAADD